MSAKNLSLSLMLVASGIAQNVVAQDEVHGGSERLQSEDPLSTDSDMLRETVKRFFNVGDGYRLDDLIVRSQVEELQAYFRRTRGQTYLSHPRFCKNVISDSDLLARIFSSAEGQVFLRKVAKSLGGYERLDHLCITAMGRKVLSEMVASGDDRALVQYILVQEERRTDQHDLLLGEGTGSTGPRPSRNRLKIYSVDDLLQALIPSFPIANPSPKKMGTKG